MRSTRRQTRAASAAGASSNGRALRRARGAAARSCATVCEWPCGDRSRGRASDGFGALAGGIRRGNRRGKSRPRVLHRHKAFLLFLPGLVVTTRIARLQLRDQGSNSSQEERRRVSAPPSWFPFETMVVLLCSTHEPEARSTY